MKVLQIFLTNSLSLEYHDDESSNLSMLIELCDLASTMISVLSALQDAAHLEPILQFVKKVVDAHGQQSEVEDDHTTTTTALPSSKVKKQNIVEKLLTLSIEVVSSSVGYLWVGEVMEGQEEQQGRGQNSIEGGRGKSPEKNIAGNINLKNRKISLESLAALFDVLTICVDRCPKLLVNLRGGSTMDDESFSFERAFNVAIETMNEKEVNISRSSMIFLKSVVDLQPNRISQQKQHSDTDVVMDEIRQNRAFDGRNEEMITRVRNELFHKLINGAIMGVFPRESLDSAAGLLYSLLIKTSPMEMDVFLHTISSKRSGRGGDHHQLLSSLFLLGDETINVILRVLEECSNAINSPSYLMNFYADLWNLYQTDDVGGIAGGNIVKKFERKYDSKLEK